MTHNDTLYQPLWKKYLPVIELQMRNAHKGPKSIRMTKHEFEQFGQKTKNGYRFNLELTNGKLTSKLNDSQLAKDLKDILFASESAKKMMEGKKYVFQNDAELNLIISVIEN